MAAEGSGPIRCGCCGVPISGFPTDFSAAPPWRRLGVTERDYDERVVAGSGYCTIDEHRFIRGLIELPILGLDDTFAFGVWCSVSPEAFERALKRWDRPRAAAAGPAAGALCTEIAGYPRPTWSLPVTLHPRTPPEYPRVEVEPGSHPLADEQASGITVERWHRLVKALLG